MHQHSALLVSVWWTRTEPGPELSRRSEAIELSGIHAVSVQGLCPLKDPAFVVFEGESFRDLVNLVSCC